MTDSKGAKVSTVAPQDAIEIEQVENDRNAPEYSKLEATIFTTDIAPRPISRDGQHVQRHAELSDLTVNELDHGYEVNLEEYPFVRIDSAQELFAGVLYQEHLRVDQNFSEKTWIESFSVDESGAKWLQLDEHHLRALVKGVSERCNNVAALSTSNGMRKLSGSRRALLFFLPLTPTTSDASFKNTVPMTRSSTSDLFSSLSLNPAFLLNMLGRPDYWAPQSRWDHDGDHFLGCDFSCQYPRWNLQAQGAPLSVYCKYDAQRDLTVYLISHKPNDTVIRSLRAVLSNTTRHQARSHIANVLLDSPFDIHVVISQLNFEASKWHVERFRRFQWSVVNKVDDHLAGLESNDRSKLKQLTKELQIVSQNADSHIANAEVFLFTVRGIRDIATRLHVSEQGQIRQRTLDILDFVIRSMEKQQMWFLNYKGRKDSTMRLVFNLVTQQDALNNIELAADMKKDSTSMAAIASLTMVFLPGTFTASVLSAGIFQSTPSMSSFKVTGLWWLWVATTFPITIITVLCWWWYKGKKEKRVLPIAKNNDHISVES
ncbi:uncharacterized protein BDR25DRAFT_274255 [Lindgomyces ingoldianus]|uniref:Uncharacterized protein n=1 Tax=Lindgomyces ingoldianus TaxID=673940 RepID=A0ACB6Q7U5_9PLEO|nr:uncharacterized protein BDR25DRAFT_274255 [Lindgomyces ingoldianus]KAF2462653.1 hypothetical protein BDR25DRAFT_274255 [Lindgomyces ingoldianus]